MKKRSNIISYVLVIFGFLFLLINSCKKDEDTVVEPPSVTDIQGNKYNIVTIGTQTWMASNLRVKKLNDESDIPLVTNANQWENTTVPAHCYYDNDSVKYTDPFAVLYNWFSVNSGKLCPEGWHVPTDADWTILVDYLGGEDTAGGLLKETGIDHWVNPNVGATNITGFNAIPGGYRNYTGQFFNVGTTGSWWSSSEENQGYAWYRTIRNNLTTIANNNGLKQRGLSVRCVKN
jgi:uncharacterized protein (TIGR02145 family)